MKKSSTVNKKSQYTLGKKTEIKQKNALNMN